MPLDAPVVCVASANRWAFSQTFIRAHIERLPARVKVLGAFGGGFGDAKRLLAFRVERELNELSRRTRSKCLTKLPNFQVRSYLKREQIDAVLAEFGPTGALLCNDCKAVNVPLIVHFHGYGAYSKRILASYERDYRRLFRDARAIVVVSSHMRDHLSRLGAPEEKLFCVPCGVDVTQFRAAAPGKSPPHFVAAGRFVKKKAPHVTIRAFRKVLDVHADARLTMIGDGPLRAQCVALAEHLKLGHAVKFLPVQPHDEIASLMRSARAFVHHAVTTPDGDSEGTPVAVLEAAASGLPVVSTQHGGIPDVVLHNTTGFLVGEGDADGMASHMIELAADPQLAASFGSKAREHVCAHGSMDRRIEQLWSVIEGAIRAENR